MRYNVCNFFPGDPNNRNWLRADVALDSRYNDFYVGIEATVGGDDKTDIAIDDVSFTSGCYVGGTPAPPTGKILFFTFIQSFFYIYMFLLFRSQFDAFTVGQ